MQMGRTLLAFVLLTGACTDELDMTSDVQEAATVATGVDYSWARPSPSSLASSGYAFAVRYYSYDTTGKNLSHDEAQALIGAGLSVVSNWENAAGDALDGYDRGVQHARDAEAQAMAAGAPPTRPIYFSVDFDASPGQQAAINAYFDGVASVIGRERTGAYGGYYVIKRLFDAGKITWGWQTYAWSGGQWDSRAQLRQVQNGIAGGSMDLDEAQAADFGQWGKDSIPRGYLDAAECDNVSGWAQDQDHPDDAIAVQVSFDGAPGDGGATQVATTANIQRDDLCDAIGSCAHGFSLPVPAALRDGKPHTVSAYGIDTEGVSNAELTDGGKTVTCDPPRPTIAPDIGVRRHITSPDVLAAWGLHGYDVVTLADDQMDAYTDGGDIAAAPQLIQADGDPAVYLVDGPDGTILRHVTSTASMVAWHFTADMVKTVDPAELDNYTIGAPLPDAPFVTKGSGPAVYVLDVGDVSNPDATVPGSGMDGGCQVGGGGGGGGMAGGLVLLGLVLSPLRRRRRRQAGRRQAGRVTRA